MDLTTLIFKQCVKSISRVEPAPASILEWCKLQQEVLSEPDHHAFLLVDIVSNFVNIYFDLNKGSYVGREKIILEELLVLEGKLEKWEEELPENWKFTVEQLPADSPEKGRFNGYCHGYRDLW